MKDDKLVLDCPMGRNDIEAKTVREYLLTLLSTLWELEESFSGKRPFGNSGWQNDIYSSLVAYGLVKGCLDEDGYLEECDEQKASQMIFSAIKSLR